MLSLDHPAWLAAAAAVVLPIVLHLWARRPPATVAVGSVRFLGAGEPRQARRALLHDLPLLLLRCAVISLAALLLAGPRWRGSPAAGSAQLALVLPAVASAAASDQALTARLDSLGATGTDLRAAVTGLPRLVRGAPPDTAATDLWARLVEADASLPPGTTLLVVGTPTLPMLAGTRPALGRTVRWLPMGPVPATGSFAADTFRVVLAAPAARAADTAAVRAAIEAAAGATGRPVRVAPASPGLGSLDGDFILWLDGAPTPAGRVAAAAGATVVTDQAAAPPLDAARRGWPWRTAHGDPLVRREPLGRGSMVSVGARLSVGDPDAPALPDLFADLLGEPEAARRLAAAPMSATTAMPLAGPAAVTGATPAPPGTSLAGAAWLAVLAAFAAERVLAARRAVAAA